MPKARQTTKTRVLKIRAEGTGAHRRFFAREAQEAETSSMTEDELVAWLDVNFSGESLHVVLNETGPYSSYRALADAVGSALGIKRLKN